jgi:gas vesicle protein
MSRNDETDDPYVVIEKRGGGIAPFLVGLAVGAGLALLLAPQSGAETRRMIKRRARRAADSMRDAAGDMADGVRDQVEHAKRRVEEGIETAKDALEREKRHAKQAVRTGRDAARAAREELEARLHESRAGSRRTTATAGDELDDDDGV